MKAGAMRRKDEEVYDHIMHCNIYLHNVMKFIFNFFN